MIVVVAVSAVVSELPAQVAAQQEHPSIDEFIAGLKKAEAAVRTLSVSLNSKSKRDFTVALFPGMNTKSIRSTWQETWHVDSAGRGWNRATGKTTTTNADDSVREVQIDQHATFDGVSGRSISIETSGNGGAARRGSSQKGMVRRGVSPFDFTTQHHGKPISELLTQRRGRITGQQEWDDHEVTVIELEPIENGNEYKSEFWIDPVRNYVVVRRRNLMRTTPQGNWSTIFSVDAFGHEEVAPGVWLPKVALTRNFDLPSGDESEGQINHNYKAFCRDWKLNVELPDSEMTLDFPPGVKVPGMLEAFQAKQRKLSNFYVQPLTSELHRKLISGRDTVAYASLDVTALVDVNSHQITPARFDFDGLQARLQEVSGRTKAGTLLLHFDFGALGTDDILDTFVREPLTALAKKSGFQNVRVSNTYHNDGKAWQPLAEQGTDAADENNLGDARVEVFAVRTRLSRSLTKDSDYLIELTERLGTESTQLLDDQATQTLQAAVAEENLDGASVSVRFFVGDGNASHPGADQLPHCKSNSEMQWAVVKLLRSLGFGDIKITVKNGFTNYASDYPVDAQP
jgi:hypothetical protein